MSKRTIEREYKQFLSVAERWKDLVVSNSVFHDTSYNGEDFRHVALTHDPDVLKEAEKCLVAWKAFVDVCRNAGGEKLNIVETAYLPIPFIIEDTNQSTHIVVSTASTTRTFTRESLLKKYDKVIKKSKKSPIFSQVVGALEEERHFFAMEPEGELYRARKDGYTDVVLTSALTSDNTLSRLRVGAHGALVFSRNKELKIPVVNNVDERRSITVYSGVKPIPCGPLGDFSLYRVNDITRNQPSYVAKAYILRSIESRNLSFNNKSQALLNSTPPEIRHVIERKVNAAREALIRLEKMDMELIDVMMASGDDLTGVRLTDARKKYGKEIEERYGYTFNQTMSATKLR